MSRTTSRRAILGALATVPMAAAPALAALPAGAGEPHPDAALFALVARFVEADRLSEEASEALNVVVSACDASEPPRPDALRRTKDFPILFGEACNRSSPEFYTYQECEQFRRDYLSPRARTPGTTTYERRSRRERVAEIVAAHDAWEAACDANEAALGLLAAEERACVAFDLFVQIRAEIRDTRPATLAGFVAKARAWEACDEKGLFAAAIRADLLAIGGEP